MSEWHIKSVLVRSAPTIQGLRPANIVTLRKNDFDDYESSLLNLENLLRAKRVRLERIHESAGAVQIMIYRYAAILSVLRDKETKAMLERRGYQPSRGVETALRVLSARMGERGGFPHEIGVFLGYPPEDVRGFVRNKGKNYKYNGYWKVYGDLERCKSRFAAYDVCRNSVAERMNRGASLEELIN